MTCEMCFVLNLKWQYCDLESLPNHSRWAAVQQNQNLEYLDCSAFQPEQSLERYQQSSTASQVYLTPLLQRSAGQPLLSSHQLPFPSIEHLPSSTLSCNGGCPCLPLPPHSLYSSKSSPFPFQF